MGGLVSVLTLGVTSAAMAVLYGADPDPGRLIEVTVLTLASITATVTRYLALKSWVFAIRFPKPGDRQPGGTTGQSPGGGADFSS